VQNAEWAEHGNTKRRGGFVNLVTISRKSIRGAKLSGFVRVNQRGTRDFSFWTVARGDKMR
jgi:hypothetical protein